MHTSTLFTVLVAFFFTFLSCASALPVLVDSKGTAAEPRSLLGRTFDRHVIAPAVVLPRAPHPDDDRGMFYGRAERFNAIHKRFASRHLDESEAGTQNGVSA
ncbi:hypothetical protein H0H93_016051, partial [Arthromyces matolae]